MQSQYLLAAACQNIKKIVLLLARLLAFLRPRKALTGGLELLLNPAKPEHDLRSRKLTRHPAPVKNPETANPSENAGVCQQSDPAEAGPESFRYLLNQFSCGFGIGVIMRRWAIGSHV